MEKMPFPEIMASGFSFDEAITMTELCRRVYKVFENPQHDAEELYDAMYKRDEWEFLHGISDYETDGRLLILKRKNKNQFAIVFRGTIFTSSGFEFTGESGNEDIRLDKYAIIPGEPMPPSRNVRVYAGMQIGFEVFIDEFLLFFDVLLNFKLSEKQIDDLINASAEKQDSKIRAIYAAVCCRNKMSKVIVSKSVLPDIKNAVYNKNKKEGIDNIWTIANKMVSSGFDLREYSPYNVFKYNFETMEVYVTGHSRGGSLATFAVLYLKRYYDSRDREALEPTETDESNETDESKQLSASLNLKMYNIGSTKVGNQAFVDYYNQQMKGFSYRIQNVMDPATYTPLPTSIPFSYNLQLMIPGIEFVREGDLFYAHYEHVGEVYPLFGTGDQKLDLDFGGPLKFTIPVPFPHGPDGYKRMLIEARDRERTAFRFIGNLFSLQFELQKQAFLSLYQELHQIHGDAAPSYKDRSVISIAGIYEKLDQIEQKLFSADSSSVMSTTTEELPSSQLGRENQEGATEDKEQETGDRAQPALRGE